MQLIWEEAFPNQLRLCLRGQTRVTTLGVRRAFLSQSCQALQETAPLLAMTAELAVQNVHQAP